MLILLAISSLFAIVGVLPAISKKKQSWLIAWYNSPFFLLVVLWPGFYLVNIGNKESVANLNYLTCGIGLGIMSDIIFIALTRRLLRWSAGLQSFYKIATVVFLNCLVAFVLVIGPYLLARLIARLSIEWSTGTLIPAYLVPIRLLILMAFSNSITALTALFFVVLALIMLLHRLFWPVLERPIYALQRVGITSRNKLFGIIGIILMGIPFGIQPSWLIEIVDKLTS